MLETTIVVPAWNNFPYTRALIESIRDNTENYEIILVDNGSTDTTKELLPMHDLWIIRNETNLGFPKAVNQGLREVKTEYSVILNNDCVVTPHWLEKLINHLKKYDIVGPISNYIAGRQRKHISIYRDKKELYDVSNSMSRINNGKTEEVNWLIGMCLCFKTEILRSVGLLDEDFGIGNSEDLLWCYQAKQKGYKLAIAHDTYLHHAGSQTFQALGIDYSELLQKNTELLKQKMDGKPFPKQVIE
jgi:GT2 family glycosyltransferase